jgi:Zn-dependent oligopeptidase
LAFAENVLNFLESLAEKIKPLVEKDIADMKEMKMKFGGSDQVSKNFVPMRSC